MAHSQTSLDKLHKVRDFTIKPASSAFTNVPVEPDTRILVSKEVQVQELQALYQRWFWDGVRASSLIFITGDVSEFSDAELEAKIQADGWLSTDEATTIVRQPEFTFFNYDFSF